MGGRIELNALDGGTIVNGSPIKGIIIGPRPTCNCRLQAFKKRCNIPVRLYHSKWTLCCYLKS